MGTPRLIKRAATVLFPDAIPPVNPKTCTLGFYRRTPPIARARGWYKWGQVNRRRFLKIGIAGGALVLVGSAIALVRTRGYEVSKERAAKLVALEPWQLIVVEHAARRIAAPDRDGVPTADTVDVAGFVDAFVAEMPSAVRRDLLRLLGYVEHVAPLAVGFASRFSRLTANDQDKVLEGMESSDQDLIRGGFAGLKSLVFMGYYRDPRTWGALGYDGPLVARPAGGWW
jgi:hypothetical protein